MNNEEKKTVSFEEFKKQAKVEEFKRGFKEGFDNYVVKPVVSVGKWAFGRNLRCLYFFRKEEMDNGKLGCSTEA